MADLKKIQASVVFQLNELKGMIRLDSPWHEFTTVSRDVCDGFLTLASASLLCDYNSKMFFTNLARSAENWRRFLLAVHTPYKQFLSFQYHLPLFAAIVANKPLLISNIRIALPVRWQGKGYEYTFHIVWLYTLIFQHKCISTAEMESHLEALENCEADENRRLLFMALLGLSELKEADFWQSFEQMLMSHEQYVQATLGSPALQVKRFSAQRFMWLEGLAILRLAKMKGFTLPSKGILFCPDEALVDNTPTYTGDWPLIPLHQANA